MTLMLASVTGPQEAETALAHGADIIDLKDSTNGAFGAISPETVRATAAVVKDRRPLSAVSGEVPMEPDAMLAAAGARAEAGAEYVKVGLFPGAHRLDCIRALLGEDLIILGSPNVVSVTLNQHRQPWLAK